MESDKKLTIIIITTFVVEICNKFFHFFSQAVSLVFPCNIDPATNTFTCDLLYNLYDVLFQTFLTFIYFTTLIIYIYRLIKRKKKTKK